MLGRGVKRKWSCLEELEAEVVAEATITEEKEQSGKDGQEDEAGLLIDPSKSVMSHLQQRQRVLGLCLEKLQRYQAGMELSLRRSVLLINTLRQIQEEIRSDGVGTCTSDSRLSISGVHADDSCLLRDDFREDVPVTCPGCAEGDGESLSLSPPLSPEFPSQEAIDFPDQQKSLPAAAISTFSDAVNAMGYLSDLALDDIFEDIDTSMYETSDLPSAWAAGSLWPVSVSLWPDEDVKLRSSSHSSTGSLQSCLVDLNDLDHIMEILVKSWSPRWTSEHFLSFFLGAAPAELGLTNSFWWTLSFFFSFSFNGLSDSLAENFSQGWASLRWNETLILICTCLLWGPSYAPMLVPQEIWNIYYNRWRITFRASYKVRHPWYNSFALFLIVISPKLLLTGKVKIENLTQFVSWAKMERNYFCLCILFNFFLVFLCWGFGLSEK